MHYCKDKSFTFKLWVFFFLIIILYYYAYIIINTGMKQG